MPFNGLSQRTVDFLFENRMHDSKAWFEEHRGEYNDSVLTPLRELVKALTPTMLDIDPQFTVDPAVNKTISRIYRDTRFSKDKSHFRSEMWITFMRNKKFWQGLPGYYFIFGPAGFFYGFGYYEATKEAMDIMRDMIIKGDKTFLTALEAYEKQDVYEITGEKFKRSKYPDQPENLKNWLDRKSISFEHTSDDMGLLFSPKLAEVLAKDFKLIKPIYDFIITVESRKQHELPVK